VSEESLGDLRKHIAAFRDERDWAQFHSPKNLAMAIAVEAAELLEIYLWRPDSEGHTDEDRERTKEEIADVLILLLSLADRLDIDLAAAVGEKLARNARKYPSELVRGSAKKYTEYQK